ncbi:hypothetical protein D3C87_2048220 [compost metagenome]
MGKRHQRQADRCQEDLHRDEEFAAIENVGEHTRRDGEQEDRQGARRLNHGDRGR